MKTKLNLVSTKNLSPELLQGMELAGIQVTHHDFIQKAICIPDKLDRNSIHPVVVLTSKTGAQAWVEIVNQLGLDITQCAVYCLASGTTILANQPGVNIKGLGQDASSLADIILNDKLITGVSYICGNLRRDELPEKLIQNGIKVQEIIAYKTILTPLEIRVDYYGVLFFSPSGIDSYLQLNKNTTCTAFCIGGTTASYAQAVGFSKIQIADTPTPESLVRKAIHSDKTQIIHA